MTASSSSRSAAIGSGATLAAARPARCRDALSSAPPTASTTAPAPPSRTVRPRGAGSGSWSRAVARSPTAAVMSPASAAASAARPAARAAAAPSSALPTPRQRAAASSRAPSAAAPAAATPAARPSESVPGGERAVGRVDGPEHVAVAPGLLGLIASDSIRTICAITIGPVPSSGSPSVACRQCWRGWAAASMSPYTLGPGISRHSRAGLRGDAGRVRGPGRVVGEQSPTRGRPGCPRSCARRRGRRPPSPGPASG